MGPHRPPFRAPIAILATILTAIMAAPVARGADVPLPMDGATPADSATAPRYRLEPVVVTAERLPLALRRVPLDVTVIGSDRLAAERQMFLSDALREVASIDVQRSGSAGKLTDVRLRGADPRHTLVLFDGIPLNGPWLGTFDFADLAGGGAERVEILGGPSSSLYGSGAVGGVIQALTPAGAEGASGRARAPGLRAFAEYGEGASLRQGGAWSGARGRSRGGLSLSHLTSDGAGPRDAYRGLSGTLYGALDPSASDRIRVSALGTSGRKELPYDFAFDATDPTLSPFGSFKEVLDPNYEERDRLLAGRATWTHRLGRLGSVEVEGSQFRARIENDNKPNPGGSGDFQETVMENSRGVGTLRARVGAGPGAQALIGAEVRRERVERRDASSYGGFASASDIDRGINARALYAQAHGELSGRLLADAGIRLDDHSRYGSYGVPRVALGFDWREAGLKLRGGYGRAFTAPTLSDLYYPGYSSDSLRPERSATWECGADGRWLGNRLEAHATVHRTRFRDLIQSSSFFAPGNVGAARIEGAEGSVRLAPRADLAIGGSAARLLAKSLVTGDRLAKRPAWRFGAWVEARPLGSVPVAAAWRWVDSVRDPFDFIDAGGRTLRGDTPGYASLDLGVFPSLHRWAPLDLSLRVTNALDREYSEVKGFPARRRALSVGLTFSRNGSPGLARADEGRMQML
jgi:vitamin B12 transporter